MSKIVVTIYSLLILIQSFNINLEDISKFNSFLEHSKYHKETYGDSFLKFLSEHYGNEMMSHDDEHSEHEDLPFKDPHHFLCHTNTSFLLTKQIIYILNPQGFIEKPTLFLYKESFSSFEKPHIFQPPKLA